MRAAVSLIAICVMLATASRPALSQQSPARDEETVRVQTTLVTVPVGVTDRDGRFVAGLRKENFRVYEDGVEQSVAFFAPVESPFTVVILIDTSPSTGFVLGEIVDAANVFMNRLRPDDRCAMVFFDRKMHEIIKLTEVRDLRPVVVDHKPACCGTSLYDAVDFALRKKLKDVPGKKAIVMFTDGVDTTSRGNHGASVRRAEEADVAIYPVQYDTLRRRSPSEERVEMPRGMRPEDYERAGVYLKELAQKTGGRLHRGGDLGKLATAFAAIARELGQRYSVGYYARAPVKSGQSRQVKVSVSIAGLAAHARKSYVSPQQK